MRSTIAFVLLAAILCPAQDAVSPTFSAQTNLVLLPFHVGRDKYYVSDLKAADIRLLEDGLPREFSVFEGPSTPNRAPIELLLLFDTSIPPGTDWSQVYDFVHTWNDELSRETLEQGRSNIQVSVYKYDSAGWQPLSATTKVPHELSIAFEKLLMPGTDSSATRLISPLVDLNRFPQAAVVTLKAANSGNARVERKLIAFYHFSWHGFVDARGQSWKNTPQLQAWRTDANQEVAEASRAAGIPIYSVAITHLASKAPWPADRNWDIDALHKLASSTGGSYFDVLTVDLAHFREILESVKNEALSEYTVGFAPQSRSDTPRPHHLEIKLVSKASGKLIGGKRDAAY